MLSKIKQEIGTILSDTLNETNYNITLLEKKLKTFQNLIEKSENLPKTKQNEKKDSLISFSEIDELESDLKQKENQKQNIALDSFSWIGKKFLNIVPNISKNHKDEIEKIQQIHSEASIRSFNHYIDNDPFENTKNNKNQLSDFDKVYLQKEQKKDEIAISALSNLKQLPENSSKIDKILYLLKKNYSYEEISNALQVDEADISMIKKFKL